MGVTFSTNSQGFVGDKNRMMVPVFDVPVFDVPVFDVPVFDVPVFDVPVFDVVVCAVACIIWFFATTQMA